MDKFEKIIKESVEHYEVPYSDDAWKALSKKMGPEKGLMTKWIIGVAAGLVLISGAVWFSTSDVIEDTNNLSSVQETTVNNTVPALSNNNTNSDTKIVTEHNTVEPETAEINDIESHTAEPYAEPASEERTTAQTHESITTPTPFPTVEDRESSISQIEIHENTIEPNVSKAEGELVFDEATLDYSKLDLNIVTDKNEVCFGKPVLFKPSIPKIKAIYQWDLGDGNVIEANFVDHIYDEPGHYVVKLQLLDTKTKKVLKSTETKTVTVQALPENHIDYEFVQTAIPTIYFSQNTKPGYKVIWDIENEGRITGHNFSYEFRKEGTYLVKSTVFNALGCSTTSTETVRIEDSYNLLAPKGFSPNGDGTNETFIPKALETGDVQFTMKIFSRTGDLVFQTSDANSPWDGLYTKDLTPAPETTYIWVVELTNDSGKQEVYKGTVILIRP